MQVDRSYKNRDFLKISYNDKHIKHCLSVEKVNEMTQVEKRYPMARLPVCNHCEALALWSRPLEDGRATGTCLKCGTITIDPINLAEYLVSGYDLPMDMSAETKEEIKVKRSLIVDEL